MPTNLTLQLESVKSTALHQTAEASAAAARLSRTKLFKLIFGHELEILAAAGCNAPDTKRAMVIVLENSLLLALFQFLQRFGNRKSSRLQDRMGPR